MNGKSEKQILLALIILQGLCALFFVWDGVVDLVMGPRYEGWADPANFEFIVAVALLASLSFTALRMKHLMNRQKRMADQLQIAAGQFSTLLEQHFEDWGLSDAEADVAMLAVKGLSIAEIADLRSSRQGTVKAQLNAVYRKAGVTGRSQLLSIFIEELMGDGLPTANTDS